jgi:hypothetical protein
MDMASKHPIPRLRACIHLVVGHFMGLSLAQAVVGFLGVEAVAESLVAGEGFVDSKRINCMGAIDEARGIGQNLLCV